MKKHLEERLASVTPDYLLLTDKMDSNPQVVCEQKLYIDLPKFYGNSNDLMLEIGCGRGGFAVKYGLANLQQNVLAVERSANVIIEACELAQRTKLANVKFINTGAQYLLRYLRPHSVSSIYMNFPNPYFKRTYFNNRLTNARFLPMYQNLLVAGGSFYLKTDNVDLFNFSLEQFSAYNCTICALTRDLAKSTIPNLTTEYEDKFTSMNLPINYVEVKFPQIND
ncbi:MAG: tRNA (guanosine(46)-N7)-methyltransferase TrmB [Clostridia bacterium]